jgi:hypothetical protein
VRASLVSSLIGVAPFKRKADAVGNVTRFCVGKIRQTYYALTTMKQRRPLAQVAIAAGVPIRGTLSVTAPTAGVDAVAYLLNVTVRPGYNFANADEALAYGHGICDRIARGDDYASIARDVKVDFNTSGIRRRI